jgi:hypothetical protein
VTDAVQKIGDALWLYVRLVAITNGNGQVCRTLDSLAKDLGVKPEQVEAWLVRLVHAGLVGVHVPAPYLVIKLRFWSGSDGEHSAASGENGSNGVPHRDVPVSSSKLQAAAASSSKREDGGLGEGGEALLAEVLRVLGETDGAEFRDLLPQFPKPVILKALLRVKTTPGNQIRKSKAALFRYLLAKFIDEAHAQTHQP